MSPPLFLNSLEIHQFRAFRHLRVERLGRINLIVGKNNVGKSCFLEALQLYANQGSLRLIQQLLNARDENKRPLIGDLENDETQFTTIKYLFYGRKDFGEVSESIQIGPIDSWENTLSIMIGWYTEQTDGEKRYPRQLTLSEKSTMVN